MRRVSINSSVGPKKYINRPKKHTDRPKKRAINEEFI